MVYAAPTGLPLPLELVVYIVKCCAGYDSEEDPDTRYEYFSGGREFFGYEDYEATWTIAPYWTKQDICSIRLVCKQFRTASLESFGTVLGDRRFRITETGLRELQDIKAVKELVPWIKTLTFGTAELFDHTAEDYLAPGDLPGDPIPVGQVKVLKSAFNGYLVQHRSVDHKKALSEVLVAFQNLKVARIEVVDKSHYLWGMLDAELILKSREYGKEIAAEVLEAILEAGLTLKGLRTSLQTPIRPRPCLLPRSIHTLHITVDLTFFMPTAMEDGDGPFLKALEEMEGLEKLAINLDMGILRKIHDDYHSGFEDIAVFLFRALEKATNLRDVTLEGDWEFTVKSIVAFVKRHASSLRHLTLYNCILSHSWIRVLRAIADLTRDQLEHLSVIYPLYVTSEDTVVDEDFSDIFVCEWPQFSCITHIGPYVLLKDDTNARGGIAGSTDAENTNGAEENGYEDRDKEGDSEEENNQEVAA
jgi:hypothetical protein